MTLTNTQNNFPKNKVLITLINAFIIALIFPAKSYAHVSKANLIESNSLLENTNPENLRQLNILLVLIVILLSLSIAILWKKNLELGQETSQIKSSLNQYLFKTTSNEDFKSIQEENKQQALILNERQQKIVDLMAFGYSNKQIADKLFISENTVKYHIKNIYQVLHVKDRKQLWLSQS